MGIRIGHQNKQKTLRHLEQPSLLDWWVERMKAAVAPRRRPPAWTLDRQGNRGPGRLARA